MGGSRSRTTVRRSMVEWSRGSAQVDVAEAHYRSAPRQVGERKIKRRLGLEQSSQFPSGACLWNKIQKII
jgi:hypothetical protein